MVGNVTVIWLSPRKDSQHVPSWWFQDSKQEWSQVNFLTTFPILLIKLFQVTWNCEHSTSNLFLQQNQSSNFTKRNYTHSFAWCAQNTYLKIAGISKKTMYTVGIARMCSIWNETSTAKNVSFIMRHTLWGGVGCYGKVLSLTHFPISDQITKQNLGERFSLKGFSNHLFWLICNMHLQIG